MDILSEDDKVKIFVSLIMSTDIKILYCNNKLMIHLDDNYTDKISTYIKTKDSSR